MIEVRAYAKVNLTLEVLSRRADGYHELRSVVQTVRLHDTLRLARDRAWQVSLDPPVEVEDNLILRAGRSLERVLGRALPTRVWCAKRIPVGAGMGGGSSDAAGALLGLRRLWELPVRASELQPVAAGLGSDVPFLLRGGTALLSGRGELVTPLPPLSPQWVVLAVPQQRLAAKTATMYRALNASHYTGGDYSERFVAALGESRVPVNGTWNVFELVADEVFPGLGALRERLSLRSGATFRMSGAGPSLYALLPDRAAAQRCLQRLVDEPVSLLATTTIRSGPRVRWATGAR